MSFGSLARRYSKALLILAKEGDLLQTVADDLQTFTRILLENTVMKDFLGSDQIVPERKKEAMKEIGARLGLNGLTANFLFLLADKERLAALPDMTREYLRGVDRELGQARADLVSATQIDSPTGEAIRKALEARTGKKIILSHTVDSRILGGLVLKMEGSLWDASLSGELMRLKEEMLS